MRGQDLFDQSRASPRQPDDEDRVRPLAAEAPPGCEEFTGANLLLQARIALDQFGLVAALALLECIAALVVAEGLGVLAAILECLAEREAEVIAVHETRRRGRLLTAHARELLVREAGGLEVGEAPVRVAIPWPHRGGLAVGLDRLRLPAEGFEGVADRQNQVRSLRAVDQQLAVHLQCLLMPAEATAGLAVEGPVRRVARLELQELAGLLDRLQVLVTLHQHRRVLVARCAVIWREHQHTLEQELGVVEYPELDAN